VATLTTVFARFARHAHWAAAACDGGLLGYGIIAIRDDRSDVLPLTVLAIAAVSLTFFAVRHALRRRRQWQAERARRLAAMAQERARQQAIAEADTQLLPVFIPYPSPPTYVSLRNTADDELRMALRRDLETTGDISLTPR